MIYRLICVVMALAIVAHFATGAKADAPKEVKTEKNKPVFLGNFLSAPTNCSSNPGPVPLPRLREKPANGIVGLQIVAADVAGTDACAARKIPAIAMFYTPNKDFVGKDSVQVEFETGSENKLPNLSFVITVEASGK